MDRFDLIPKTLADDGEDTEHIGLVWDRGTAGDFVYGNLNELSPAEKKQRYEEFIAFDKQVRFSMQLNHRFYIWHWCLTRTSFSSAVIKISFS
mmetsp:Transcript_31963/g.41129  ORF Transcript_31963/g.41129 Transcript_31963/m.41129 type:complete len:93 (-) Transcript_31963:761-1039(-)